MSGAPWNSPIAWMRFSGEAVRRPPAISPLPAVASAPPHLAPLPISVKLELRQILRAWLMQYSYALKDQNTVRKGDDATYRAACDAVVKRLVQQELYTLLCLFYEPSQSKKLADAWESLGQPGTASAAAATLVAKQLETMRGDVWKAQEIGAYLEPYIQSFVRFMQHWERGEWDQALAMFEVLLKKALLLADFLAIRLLRGRGA